MSATGLALPTGTRLDPGPSATGLGLPTGLGRSAAFDPRSLATLAFWFDASQLTGLNDGDAVASWPDLSANALTMTQGTAGAKPTYKTAVQNGRPIVRFDGGDLMVHASADFSAAAAISVFAVVKVSDITASRAIVTHGSLGTNPSAWEMLAAITTGKHVFQAQGNVGVAAYTDVALGTTLFHQLTGTWDMTLATNEAQAWTDGVQGGSVTTNSNNTGTALGNLTLSLGQRQNGGLVFTGDIAEVIGYTRLLAPSERQQLERALKTKWGTP